MECPRCDGHGHICRECGLPMDVMDGDVCAECVNEKTKEIKKHG